MSRQLLHVDDSHSRGAVPYTRVLWMPSLMKVRRKSLKHADIHLQPSPQISQLGTSIDCISRKPTIEFSQVAHNIVLLSTRSLLLSLASLLSRQWFDPRLDRAYL